MCDHDNDCGDNSDEHSNCTQPTCRPNELTCRNQRCVLIEWKCDGDNDCGDMTDEQNCCKFNVVTLPLLCAVSFSLLYKY